MAANPPYTLKNKTNDTFLYSVNHDDNMIDQIVIKGGSYIVFRKSLSEGHQMTGLEANKLDADILQRVGTDFTLVDAAGNEVTSEQFRQDNP